MNRSITYCLTAGALLAAGVLHGIDNAHFYRANNMFFEPRLDRDYLTSVDFFFQGGSTDESRNCEHETVPLFDLYGKHDMQQLAIGVPCKDLTNPLDLIIQQLSLLPSRCVTSQDASKKISQFATFSIDANFSILEGILSIAQNLKRGFFFHLYLPVRRFKVDDIRFCDCSPTDEICPNINAPIWQTFKENFCDILARYDLKVAPYNQSSIGDMSLMLGWTHSFQHTEVLDFVDTTIKFGMLIPSGEAQNVDNLFSLPFGYNKHFGAIISADFAFGVFEWLTLGTHFDALIFGDKTRCVRLKTGEHQSGIIKLAKAEAKTEEGSIWEAGAYIKFDHFIRGLSLLGGYTFTNKGTDQVTPCDTKCFNTCIANTDQSLFGYKMHTFHVAIELDFSKEDSVFGPRISGYYNFVVGGKQIFTTGVGGGNFGIDLAWDL